MGNLPALASSTQISSDTRGNLPPAFKEHRLWGQEQSQPERSRGRGGGTPHTDIGGDLDRLFFFFLTETLISQCLGPTRGSEPGDQTPSGWSTCGWCGQGVDEGSACLSFGDHIPPGKEKRENPYSEGSDQDDEQNPDTETEATVRGTHDESLKERSCWGL